MANPLGLSLFERSSSEKNWTSGLRQYAKFPACKEGLSDFVYDENMDAFKELFNLSESKKWKKAYIEVKSTMRNEGHFILIHNQFLRVQLKLFHVVRLNNSMEPINCILFYES